MIRIRINHYLITSDMFVDYDVFLVNRFEQRQSSAKSKTLLQKLHILTSKLTSILFFRGFCDVY